LVQAALVLLQQKSPHLRKRVTDVHIQEGIVVRPPCRFEQIHVDQHPNLTVLLDVAHNPPAIQLLLYKLQSQYPQVKKRLIIGFSADKDIRQCASILLHNSNDNYDTISVDRLHIVEAAHPRAAKLEDILNADPRLHQCQYDINNRSVTHQVQRALQQISNNTNDNDKNNSNEEEEEEMIVICGSVFLMAEAREALGYDEPRDSKYIAQVAGMNLRFGQENFANMGDPEQKQNQPPSSSTPDTSNTTALAT